MQGGLFLDVVVRQSTTVFQLFTGKDQTLLIRWDTFLVLDLGFDVFNGITWFNVEGDRLSRQSFDEDLHTTTKAED